MVKLWLPRLLKTHWFSPQERRNDPILTPTCTDNICRVVSGLSWHHFEAGSWVGARQDHDRRGPSKNSPGQPRLKWPQVQSVTAGGGHICICDGHDVNNSTAQRLTKRTWGYKSKVETCCSLPKLSCYNRVRLLKKKTGFNPTEMPPSRRPLNKTVFPCAI